MSQLNSRGEAADLLGVSFLTDDLQIGQHCNDIKPGCVVATTPGNVIVFDGPANTVAANGSGVWAAWVLKDGTAGVIDSLGRWFPGSGLQDPTEGPGVSLDGAIAIKVLRDSFGPWDVIESDGRRWRLTNGDAHNIQLVGHGEALWRESGDPTLHTTIGLSSLATPQGNWSWPYACRVNGVWTLLYQSESGLALVFGDRIIAEGASFFRPVVREIAPNIFRFRWTYDAGGGSPGVVTLTADEIAALPKLNLFAPAPVPVPTPKPAPVPAPAEVRTPLMLKIPPVVPFSWDSLQIVGHSPDVRSWSETTLISRLAFTTTGLVIDFDAKDRWPDIVYTGWDGPLQYTIWFAQIINGVWTATGVIQCWKGLPAAGGDVTAPNQFGTNWVYYADPLHQPLPGETIGFFVTSGNERKGLQTILSERSNFVTAVWNPAPAEFRYSAPAPAPAPAPVAPPSLPVSVPVITAPVDLTPILLALDEITKRVEALEKAPAPAVSQSVLVSGHVSLSDVLSNKLITWTGKTQ